MILFWLILLLFQCVLIILARHTRVQNPLPVADRRVIALTKPVAKEAAWILGLWEKSDFRGTNRLQKSPLRERIEEDMKYLHPAGGIRQQIQRYQTVKGECMLIVAHLGTFLCLCIAVGRRDAGAWTDLPFSVAVTEDFSPVGPAVLLLACVTCCFYCDYRLHEKAKSKRENLRSAYPEFISEFTLYYGAGASLRQTWERLCERGNFCPELREELGITRHHMDDGMSELSAYAEFGKRCRDSCYLRFASLLTQNLKRGGRELIHLLELESDSLGQERRSMIRQKGEKASTKLLFPMMLLLVMVLLLIMLPAFMNL